MGTHHRDYKTFLSRLRNARKQSGLTQSEAAQKLKKKQSYISKCESGERRVDIAELKEFAKVYRKPISYFA